MQLNGIFSLYDTSSSFGAPSFEMIEEVARSVARPLTIRVPFERVVIEGNEEIEITL